MLPPIAEPVIILAHSARALACAARAGGFQPHTIDLFGDEDTLACSASWHRMATDTRGVADSAQVLQTVRALWARVPAAPVIWGGGLEAAPVLLRALATEGCLLGSDPDGVDCLQDMVGLVSELLALDVPMPPTVAQPPAEEGWLCKRAAAAGGAHVVAATAGLQPAPGCYFQRRVAGSVHSVTLLAEARGVRVLGWNRLLADPAHAAVHFMWRGAVADPDLPQTVRASVTRSAAQVAHRLAWRGLCGLDFILADDGAQIIDLNPRPTATFPLHLEPALAFAAHLAACRGLAVPEVPPAQPVRRGLRVVHASDALRIPNSLDWPPWISDRPVRGSDVAAGDPICTVHAAGSTHADVIRLLDERTRALMTQLPTSP